MTLAVIGGDERVELIRRKQASPAIVTVLRDGCNWAEVADDDD